AYDDDSWGFSLTPKTEIIDKNTLGFVITYKRDTHRRQENSAMPWKKYITDVYSAGLEDEMQITDKLSLSAGIRFDTQKPLYANGESIRERIVSANPRAEFNYAISEESKVKFSVAETTRFPSLIELYYNYLGRNIPNPLLFSERSKNYEVGGARYFPSVKTTAEANFFLSDLSGLITNKSLGGGMRQLQNISSARHQGFEIMLKNNFIKNNAVELNYAYLDARDLSSDRTFDYLPDRPAHQLYVSDGWRFIAHAEISCRVNMASKRYYQDSYTKKWGILGEYWTADASLRVNISPSTELGATVKNVFDRLYETSFGFPGEGRMFFASIRQSF
ncbi:MAG: TonB-dependent receptor, partial [Elusimicrobia bacterium]|nr:TonB-dependent receptor [Elusimicrobiota bacterium]